MKKGLAVLLAICIMLCSAVFGLRSAAAQGEPAPESVAGSYKLTGIASDTGNMFQIVSRIVDMGVNYYLFLNSDGTGHMEFLQKEIPLTWDGEHVALTKNEGESGTVSIPYSSSDKVVRLTTRAYSMEFSALTPDEQADYDANGSGNLRGILGMVVQGLLNSIDTDLVSALLFDFALGTSDEGWEPEPIPEGEPSEGPVTGVVGEIEFTVLGSKQIEATDQPLIVFYYTITNLSDEVEGGRNMTYYDAQDGSFLEQIWVCEDAVPEMINTELSLYPGRTILAADVFAFNPDGGTVAFRINNYNEEGSVIYYADPHSLSGATDQPFMFNDGYTIPEELLGYPEQTEHVRIENVEFYKNEAGEDSVRVLYRYLNHPPVDGIYHSCCILQDGVQLSTNWSEIDFDLDDKPDDTLRVCPVIIRTDSPVVFLVYEDTDDGNKLEAVKIIELD